MRRRPALFALVLAIALVAADVWIGRRLQGGTLDGLPVPPLGTVSGQRRAWVEERVRRTRRRGPRNPGAFLNFSQRYGWTNLPGEGELQGISCVIDPDGARGWGPDAPPATPGGPRVSCFGESFTFGSEVADGEDWPARLRALEPGWHVRNFGVSAWGTDQALLRFEEVARKDPPDVAVMGFLLENACRNVNRYRQLYQDKDAGILVKPRFRLVGGELEHLPIPYRTELETWEAALDGSLRETMRRGDYWDGDDPLLSFSNLARVWAAKRAFARRRPWTVWSDFEGEPVQVSLALLERFRRDALETGAHTALVVLYQSASDHASVERLGERYWEPLYAALEARGLDYVDTYPVIAGMRAQGRKAYLVTHHTPEANHGIAELVRAWLVANAEGLDD